MDARHKLWIAALLVFGLWVASLVAMAALSGRRPTQHHRVHAPR